MVYQFFDKKSKGSGINKLNYQLASELHKPIIRKFKKRKVYLSFKDNIWGVDLADMQSLSKYNRGIKYLLCVIDFFNKYAWVIPIKDKKGNSIVNAFKKILSNSNRKPNKIWVDQGSEFYNNAFKDFLKMSNIEMYSTYNKGKSVVAERFIMSNPMKSLTKKILNLKFQFNLFILFYFYFVSFRLTTVVMITQILYKMVSKLFIRL